MPAVRELESSLTDRYQTTVPGAVRRTLKLGKRDRIRFKVQPDGAVLLSRAEPVEASDPVVGEFLRFLASDMQSHPQRVKGLDAALVRRVRSLVKNVKIDLDAPLRRAGRSARLKKRLVFEPS
jgi:antitoxin PrlF